MTLDCCLLCPIRVARLQMHLQSPRFLTLNNSREIVLLIDQLVEQQHQKIVATIFQKLLMDAKANNAMILLQLVDKIFKQIGDKVLLAFEPLLPETVRHVRLMLKNAGEATNTAVLVTLRVAWDDLFSYPTLHRLDHLMNEIDVCWPMFSPTMDNTLSLNCEFCKSKKPKVVRIEEKCSDSVNLLKICRMMQQVPKMHEKIDCLDEAVYSSRFMTNASDIYPKLERSKEALLTCRLMKRIPKLPVEKKLPKVLDSAYESEGSISPSDFNARRARRSNEPKDTIMLKIKLGNQSFENVVPKKRDSIDRDRQCDKQMVKKIRCATN